MPIHTKEKLTSKTWTAELSAEDRHFIEGEKLDIAQQSLQTTEVPLDLIIGQDLLNQVIIYDMPTRRLPSGLVSTPTVFGYTI